MAAPDGGTRHGCLRRWWDKLTGGTADATIDAHLSQEMASASLHDAFASNWEAALAARGGIPSRKGRVLLQALLRTFYRDLLVAALLKLSWGVFVLLSVSFFVRRLLTYIRFRQMDPVHTPEEQAEGYLLSAFFFVACFILSVSLQQMASVSAQLGLRVKAAITTAVYRKTLVLDRVNYQADVVSLVATDCSKLADSCTTLQFLWSGIAEALAIQGVLLAFAGRAALPGLGLLLCLVPVQYIIGLAIAGMRKKVAAASESRVHMMDEILRAVKLVKMYAWERKFANAVGEVRAQEVGLARIGGWLKSINLAIVFVLPPLIALTIFGVRSLESPLDSTLAFTTLSLFNTLRLPLVQLPKGLRAMAEASSALERLQDFLLAPEQAPRVMSERPEIVLKDASFAYKSPPAAKEGGAPAEGAQGAAATPAATATTAASDPEAGTSTALTCGLSPSDVLLKDITLAVHPGTLAMVAGPVGSGKTNLLLAILGQMRRVTGSESIGGSFAYVPQTPWCAHGTVRDNILFGKPFDELRYRRVIHACALETDLQLMAAGDATEIGERGLNLSGGQKQRIALARAAYSGAQIFLLDAPLSAVDMYTCQHIFRHCIRGIMLAAGSAVVLVTHQVELFHMADQLLVMADGRFAYSGAPTAAAIARHFPHAGAIDDSDVDVLEAARVGRAGSTSNAAGDHQQHHHASGTDSDARHRAQSGGRRHSAHDLPALGEATEGGPETESGAGLASNQVHVRIGTPTTPVLARSRAPTVGTVPSTPGGPLSGDHMSADPLNPAGSLVQRTLTLRANVLRSHSMRLSGTSIPQDGIVPSPAQGAGPGSAHAAGGPTGHEAGHSNSHSHAATGTTPQKDLTIAQTHSGRYSQGGASASSAGASSTGAGSSAGTGSPAGPATATAITPAPAKAENSALGAPVNGYLAFAWELRWYLLFPSLAIFIGTQVTRIYSDIWISLWTSKHYAAQGRDEQWYVGVYGGYVTVFFAALLFRGFSWYAMTLRAATRMHNRMFFRMLRAPMSFFTVTPLGRVLSVFAKDMDQIDEALIDSAHMVIIYIAILGTTLAVVIRVIPIFAAIAAGLALSSAVVFYYYFRASVKLKEKAGMDSAAVVAHVAETLQGMAVIQAYRAQQRFQNDNEGRVDRSTSSSSRLEMLQLWLSFRLDLVGSLLVLTSCLLAVGLESSLSPANAGLAVSNGFQILLFYSLAVRTAADINASIASVERVVQLSKLPQEVDVGNDSGSGADGGAGGSGAATEGAGAIQPLAGSAAADPTTGIPRAGWPDRGEVDFHSVVMSYLPTSPAVLKGVTFNILSGEKIGVVGRTGAGKSSLIMCLFRLAELSEGAVRIDGVDIRHLKLTELRKRIAIIPQEPVMFQGTLRSNLDPFGEHADEQLYRVLDRCLLGNMVRQLPEGLSSAVVMFGDNFSLGQQQLLCLARAMLNNSRLLLLDEATAALDSDTDAAVQRVLRTEFAERTVITIAHRLDTIIDSDRILVMDAGRVAEFDTPYTLLSQPTSIFAQLCRQTGGQYHALRAAAQRHHEALLALAVQAAETEAERNRLA